MVIRANPNNPMVYEIGSYESFGNEGQLFRTIYCTEIWQEAIKMCNFLNGGTGIIPVQEWYKGFPITPE